MATELKLRIKNYKEIEKKLKNLGAEFFQELDGKDIYFNQPKGKVLKIVKDNTGIFLSRLQAENGRFIILEHTSINNLLKKKEELAKKYGVKTILRKKRRQWKLGDILFDFNLIQDVGDFLIINSDNPKRSTVTELLGIKNPEYITVSFDELRKKK